MPVNRTLDAVPSPRVRAGADAAFPSIAPQHSSARSPAVARRSRHAGSGLGARHLALAAVVLASGVGAGALGIASAAAAPRLTPTCDEIPGQTEMLSDQWRAYWIGTPFPDEMQDDRDASLMACRRGPGPATTLVPLGHHSIAHQGCSCLTVSAPVGDLAILIRRVSNPSETRTWRTLIDLSTGRTAGLEAGDRLLPGGAILRRQGAASPTLPPPTTPPDATPSTTPTGLAPPTFTILDARGTTTLEPQALWDFSPGDRPGPTYATQEDGEPVRFDGQGAATLPLVPVAAAEHRPITSTGTIRRSSTRRRLVAANETLVVSETTTKRGGRTRRALVWGKHHRTLRATGGPARLLAADTSVAVVEGPFVGTRGRSVALVGIGTDRALRKAVAKLPAGLPSGAVALSTSGRIVVAEGDTVYFVSARPTKHAVAGAHDPQVETISGPDGVQDRIYVTDRTGAVQRLLGPTIAWRD